MFERCFIFVVCEKGVSKFGSVKAFAQRIWPDKEEKNAAQKLYDIFGVSNKTGKPQKLRLDEAVLMASLAASELSFAQLCFEISEKIRLGWVEPSREERLKAIKATPAALPPQTKTRETVAVE